MQLKSTNYYAMDFNKKGELLLMSTLNKSYIKFSPEISDSIISLLKSNEEIEFNEKNSETYKTILYNRGYLFDKEIDESLLVDVAHKTHVFSDNWLYFTILPTNNCNFRCVYCYESNKEEYMDDQTENNILEFLRKNIKKYKKLRLNWFGGEPLLEKKRVLRMSAQNRYHM